MIILRVEGKSYRTNSQKKKNIIYVCKQPILNPDVILDEKLPRISGEKHNNGCIYMRPQGAIVTVPLGSTK